jgi:dolichol kinase
LWDGLKLTCVYQSIFFLKKKEVQKLYDRPQTKKRRLLRVLYYYISCFILIWAISFTIKACAVVVEDVAPTEPHITVSPF